jgi:hypothetical protein
MRDRCRLSIDSGLKFTVDNHRTMSALFSVVISFDLSEIFVHIDPAAQHRPVFQYINPAVKRWSGQCGNPGIAEWRIATQGYKGRTKKCFHLCTASSRLKRVCDDALPAGGWTMSDRNKRTSINGVPARTASSERQPERKGLISLGGVKVCPALGQGIAGQAYLITFSFCIYCCMLAETRRRSATKSGRRFEHLMF